MIDINNFIQIQKGRIELRDDRIQEKWLQDIPAFLISPYLVTQVQFKAVMGNNPSAFIGDQLPVETVSWLDAVSFCNKLSNLNGLEPCYTINEDGDNAMFNAKANGFRLPTEGEWEYACKSGTADVRYGNLDDIAWYKENANKQTHPIGKKEPNSWGLYDMLGNVWEWCTDVYDETVYGSYRIIRGGGWSDEARGCLATNRRRSHPKAFKIDDLGFRLAKNIS